MRTTQKEKSHSYHCPKVSFQLPYPAASHIVRSLVLYYVFAIESLEIFSYLTFKTTPQTLTDCIFMTTTPVSFYGMILTPP